MTVTLNDLRRVALVITTNADKPAVNYAVNYAIYLEMLARNAAPLNDIRTQCLYVLNNIQHWRGVDAKAVRKTLKDFCAENDPRRRTASK